MKSNAKLQRFQEPDEPVPTEPSSASSSHFAPPSDAVMGMLTQIIDRLQSMDTRMTEGFRSMDDRFQVLEAHVAQIQINVQNTLCHLMPEDQRDQVP
jgi:hypothetical protein